MLTHSTSVILRLLNRLLTTDVTVVNSPASISVLAYGLALRPWHTDSVDVRCQPFQQLYVLEDDDSDVYDLEEDDCGL